MTIDNFFISAFVLFLKRDFKFQKDIIFLMNDNMIFEYENHIIQKSKYCPWPLFLFDCLFDKDWFFFWIKKHLLLLKLLLLFDFWISTHYSQQQQIDDILMIILSCMFNVIIIIIIFTFVMNSFCKMFKIHSM